MRLMLTFTKGEHMNTKKLRKYCLEYFQYRDGKLYWKKYPGAGSKGLVGKEAGYINNKGYRHVTIKNKKYQTHRIIWLIVKGYMPEHGLDHINGIKNDNHIDNLREASPRCNNQNACKYSHNTSGVPGVSWHKQHKKWYAAIVINRKHKHLGSFSNKLDAAIARYVEEQMCPDWHCSARNTTLNCIEAEFGHSAVERVIVEVSMERKKRIAI